MITFNLQTEHHREVLPALRAIYKTVTYTLSRCQQFIVESIQLLMLKVAFKLAVLVLLKSPRLSLGKVVRCVQRSDQTRHLTLWDRVGSRIGRVTTHQCIHGPVIQRAST
jgi:hypothetical protein